jgi:hypothetical protein
MKKAMVALALTVFVSLSACKREKGPVPEPTPVPQTRAVCKVVVEGGYPRCFDRNNEIVTCPGDEETAALPECAAP